MPQLNMLRMRSVAKVRRKISRCGSRSPKQRIIWSFHVVVLQRTANKCTKYYNARAQLLFCSLNLLFGDVLVAVAVVFYVRSQMSTQDVRVEAVLKIRCIVKGYIIFAVLR